VCTLILGRDVVAPNSVFLGANRDEDPARPSDPPAVLRQDPRVVGGRDRVAGGTWLAIREARAAVAILNRRDRGDGSAANALDRRSRGLLALDVAAANEPPARDGSAHALALARSAPYAPFSLVFASPDASWLLVNDGSGTPRAHEISSGWHVITHEDLDDPNEPRTRALRERLLDFRPRTTAEAEARIAELLRSHGEPGEYEHALPPVCLHEGRMVTVSSALVWLAHDQARYLHAEGRPGETPYRDVSFLLGDAPTTEERT
jgi:uncharacterized protein with NRDE domain